MELVDQTFWLIGATVCSLGAAALALATIVGLGYLAFMIVVKFRIAGLVECRPPKMFDFAAYRALYRFKHAVSFIFSGVPTELCVRDQGRIFHIDWVKNGKPNEEEQDL